jgi:pyruvate,water dikinase
MTDIRTLDQISSSDGDAVGGKGLSLGLMAGSALPVPAGFCITTAAYRRLAGRLPQSDPGLVGQIAHHYRRLGEGPVAVRSSATAEDGSITSFAGQQETVLGVKGETAVVEAVAHCWASLASERAAAYRQRQSVADADLAMAVVVQKLIPAESAGVLFTRDPLDSAGQSMLVEASWGLGESVVSGRVTPDRFQIDRDSGAVRECHVGTKPTMRTEKGWQSVPADKQSQPCLSDSQLTELANLGRQVEAFYGDARDIEWAWADGRFWLLQARPITSPGAAEREQLRREEIQTLAARAEPTGTVWSRYNLSEVLPEPTPMTWALIRRFMSGRGGYGLMYRDLGFTPDPALDDAGIFDLVCGRPYCNLSREPRMQFHGLPFEHPFTLLKTDPKKALYPQPVLNPTRADWRFWLLLPWITVKSLRAALRLKHLSRNFAQQFREHIVPRYLEAIERETKNDYAAIDSRVLLEHLEFVTTATLVDFARHSLKPTILAAVALGNLERGFLRPYGKPRIDEVLGQLATGAHPDVDANLPAAMLLVKEGKLDRAAFLEQFGHRGHHEMELSQPRWAEDCRAVDNLLASALASDGTASVSQDQVEATWEHIAREAKLAAKQRQALRIELDHLHTYLGLREAAKHYFMKGYAQIRRILVELDRRFKLNGGIFYLVPEELPRLISGEDFSKLIIQRQRRRALALSLEVPQVLFSDDLEAIGRPAQVPAAATFQGIPLSAGMAEAPALALDEPVLDAATGQPYILVCPSTDPAWVPLFVHARGLVMETGGVLSHGAIVAREFGLPAVAGIPGIHRRLRTGQVIRVNGSNGQVSVTSNIDHSA